MKKPVSGILQIASVLAHEVKNPLAGIKANAQLIRARCDCNPLCSSCGQSMDLIISEIDRIKELVDEFNEYARPREVSLKSVTLHGIIRETAKLIAPELASMRITLDLKLDPDVGQITADEGKLRRLLMNIVINAVQAIEGAGNIAVTTKKTSAGVSCVVKDTGAGIHKDHLEKIFEPFFTTKASGMGLGLCICKEIADAHGWKLSVKSGRGRGTSVELLIKTLTRD